MKKKIKINCLSNSLEDRPLPDYLYNQYGYNNIINMKNHNIGITDLNNNNSSKKKNGIYRISKNSNDSPISQKNKVIFPAISKSSFVFIMKKSCNSMSLPFVVIGSSHVASMCFHPSSVSIKFQICAGLLIL